MKLKKLLLSIITIMMVVTSSPLYVFAEEGEEEPKQEEINEPIDPIEETPIPEKDLTIYQELIDNLPDAKWVNKSNLDELLLDLAEVEQALLTLSEEEIDKLDLTKYDKLLEKVDELNNERPPLMMLLGSSPDPDPSISSTIVDEDIIVSIIAEIGVNEYTVTLPKEVDVTNNETSFTYTVEGTWTLGDHYVAVDVVTDDEGNVTLSNGTDDLDVAVSNSRYGFWSNGEGIVTLTHEEFPAPGTWECDLTTNISLKDNVIFGIKRELSNSSTGWVRNNITKGVNVKASVSGVNYYSEFDSAPIYKDIKRVVIDGSGNELEYTEDNLSLGDVMVKIPKFYYQRYQEDGTEYINISPIQQEGYELHPAFVRNDYDGTPHELPCIYVAAYKTGANHVSKSGIAPLVNTTRPGFRNGARNKISADGDGWSIIDLSAYSAIQMLILVEYANNDVQAVIGPGYTNSSNTAAIKTGSCDTMYSLGQLSGYPSGTSSNKVDVLWRGIEGFWGNVWEWTDGLNFNGGTYYICNDIFKYADDTATNYISLSYTAATNWSTSYIKEEGLDTSNPWAMMPSVVGGSENTYYADPVWTSTGWRVLIHGRSWFGAGGAGLFSVIVSDGSSYTNAYYGSRLLYIPLP